MLKFFRKIKSWFLRRRSHYLSQDVESALFRECHPRSCSGSYMDYIKEQFDSKSKKVKEEKND